MTAGETLHARQTALLVFDMLNGHVKEDGVNVPERWVEGVERIRRLLRAARESSVMVVYAAGSHRADGSTTLETLRDADNRLRPIDPAAGPERPPVVGGEWSSAVIDELAPAEQDYLVPKYRWSAFYGTYLDIALRARGIRTIVLCGGSTDIGVASTAYSARDRDFNLVVVRDACTASDPADNAYFMERAFPRLARVRDTDEVLAMLGSGRAGREG